MTEPFSSQSQDIYLPVVGKVYLGGHWPRQKGEYFVILVHLDRDQRQIDPKLEDKEGSIADSEVQGGAIQCDEQLFDMGQDF